MTYFLNPHLKNELSSLTAPNTIFALSTPLGKAGVAVIRLSGPQAYNALTCLGFQTKIAAVKSRHLYRLTLTSPMTNEILDEALVTYFPSPHSFTGQDVVEIHTHGSIAVIQDLLSELALLPQLRPAEPGEFTRLAFENGKMDLTKVEALADLLEAETKVQRRVAIQQLSGQLQRLYESWRKKLIQVMARIEAYIDFPEDDIPYEALMQAQQDIKIIADEIKNHLSLSSQSNAITHGIQVGIIGKPNVGKSSLINLLSCQEIAIVSDIAGTTRDTIQTRLQLAGYPVILYDTAGIRETDDLIEIEGVKRAKRVAQHADITLLMVDLSEVHKLEQTDSEELLKTTLFSVMQDIEEITDLDKEINQLNKENKIFLLKVAKTILNDLTCINTRPQVIILNKADLLIENQKNIIEEYKIVLERFIEKYLDSPESNRENQESNVTNPKCHKCKIVTFSAYNRINLDQLISLLKNEITNKYHLADEPIITKIRQKQRLEACLYQLAQINIHYQALELSAQELRFAANHLEIITGKIELDTVLDEIFSTFCIGK